MPRVTHFEIHAENPERAMAFYSSVFGWTFAPWPGFDYWVIVTGDSGEPGINGGLVPRRGSIDGDAIVAYVCSVLVEDGPAIERAVVDAGGTIAMPRMAIPGEGWLFYAKDTEGNIFGVMQKDSSAA